MKKFKKNNINEESKNDAEFKKKLNSLVGYFFGIIHDCRK